MSAIIIDGKKIAAGIRDSLVADIQSLKSAGITPCLVAILVGDDAASRKYVSSKGRICEKLGMRGLVHRLPAATTQQELRGLIDRLNTDRSVHGILVQLPLPRGLDEKEIMSRISPDKDVDGFSPVSLGNLVMGRPGFLPCTPHGVMKILESSGVDPSGKHAVVVGRSIIVGKPLALLLLRKNATVTVCHSKTADLPAVCRTADILCIAVGKPAMVTADMVREGAVVIDIGINVTAEGTLTGDVDFARVRQKASMITPVPGGVGPLTIALLMHNTVQAAKQQSSLLRQAE
ncbi:MAG TPA: bifunctional methylenetetrahydrofolate dehydrogenase/methenyltetrahydrofolate cyclohydrolase FolD [Dissulfurispiraceae bacterium]|nr:bifunctional methylenetetrahydrofolate dehydrogenase/methenyltetrahydrofolate cyclohydrolase FolD [Dissulfurispiraceae bacterium]